MLKSKSISILLSIAMLITCFAGFTTTVFAANAAVDTVIELEKCTIAPEAQAIADKTASGGKYITYEGGDRVDAPENVAKPDVSVTFDIPADGTYYLFMRALFSDGGKDSFHYKWDNETWQTMHPGEKTTWTWIKIAATASTDTVTLKAGKHTLSMTHREWGGQWDAIFLTTDQSKVPKDSGTAPIATPTGTATAPATTPGTSTASSNAKTFKTVEGQLMFEAEDAVVNKELVTVVSEKQASGGKAVQLSKEDKVVPPKTASGGIEFNVEIDKTAQYFMNIRYVSTSGGTDSSWLSFNGSDFKDTALPPESTDEFDYKWKKYSSMGSLTAGSKVNVKIIPRETNAKIDKIVIINSAGFVGEGMGTLPKPGEILEVKLPAGTYPVPSITPPAGHPRLLFTAKDIPAIKENMQKPQNKAAYDAWRKLVEVATAPDGNLPETAGKSNYNATTLATIEAWAFDYAINGNQESATKAITAIKNYAATCTYVGPNDYAREMGAVIFVASEVYDWCYQVMSAEDRKTIIASCEYIASSAPARDGYFGLEVGYPPNKQGAVVGHAGEAQLLRDLLSFGIATYGERPDIYNYVGGRFFKEFIVTRDFWYTSHTHHQGDAYGSYRYTWDIWSAWIIKRMSGVDIYKPDMGKAPYEWLYNRRPDGQLFRNGDCYNEGVAKGTYWTGYGVPLFYAANYYSDPYLKQEFMREVNNLNTFTNNHNTLTAVDFLLFNNPDLGGKAAGELNKTKYFGSPNGTMVARTGWSEGFNSPDAIGVMKIGEYNASNHNHRDAGNFQFYYKGILASESGFYESYNTLHDGGYNKKSVAHNVITVLDPDETIVGSHLQNDGGQRFPGGGREPATMEEWMKDDEYKTGEVLDSDFGPNPINPEYSYIKGDLTRAYTDKVTQALRSMVFMPLEDPDHPAAMIIMDKVESKQASFKKSWLLHMQQEPTISGNKSTIVRNTDGYNGKLVNETLLPENAEITKIGGTGNEFFVAGQNLALKDPISQTSSIEAGWGRIEVSPSKANKTDYFLNVMTVSDADTTAADIQSTLIEGDSYVGAIFSNRVAIFAKDADRIDKELKFSITTPGEFKVFVSGIKEGSWTISTGGEVVVTKQGGAAYFTAQGGDITLTYKDANAVRTDITTPRPQLEGINIRVNKQYIYTDVPATIVNDRTLVPMRAIFEAIQADVQWDQASSTATATKDGVEVKITLNSTTTYVNGEAKELDVPAQIVNDRFLVPIRFISESFNCTVEWDGFAKTVDVKPLGISDTAKEFPPKMGVANALMVYKLTQSGDDNEGNGISKSLDGDLATRWAVSSEGEAWGIYDLGSVKNLESTHIAFYNGNARVYTFSIAVSEDGTNYKTILDKKNTSGKTNELEKYDLSGVNARYVKFIGHGNSVNSWNSMTEIVFVEKK